MAQLQYEKSEYPISSDNLHQAIVKDGDTLMVGSLDGNMFQPDWHGFDRPAKIDLSNATEVPGLFARWEELDAHDQKMQKWRDQE